MSKRGTLLYPVVLGLLPIVVILGVWQLVSTLSIVSPTLLPPPTKIVTNLLASMTSYGKNSLLSSTVLTIERTIGGYAIALLVGIPLGIVIGSTKLAEDLTEPTIEILRTLPPVILIPIAVLLLGINDTMFILFVAFGCIWPIIINTIDGVKNTDPLLYDVASINGVSRRKALIKITLPSASPLIVSGMRISLLLALLFTIVVEMTTGYNGLGYAALFAQETLNVTSLYAEIYLVAVLGFCFHFAFLRAEYRFMKWYRLFTKVEPELV